MRLEIVTPDRKVYDDDVDMILTRTVEGDIGILPGHSPLVSSLDVTKVTIKKKGQEETLPVCGGFIEVTPDGVTILATAAEKGCEIDKTRAQQAKMRAEEQIQNGGSNLDKAEFALKKAINRLSV